MPELAARFPEALLLLVPVLLLWGIFLRRGPGALLRLLLLLVLVLAVADPELAWRRGGSDVVLVFDRSTSMEEGVRLPPELAGATSEERHRQARLILERSHEEFLRMTGEQRGQGDRLGVVLLGDGAVIAQAPRATGFVRLADRPVDPGATDLFTGLELAAGLFPAGRRGRIVLLSDGDFTGRDPRAAVAALALRGIPVDVLYRPRPPQADAAVLDCELPRGLRLGESFIGAVRFCSDRAEVRHYQILRDGKPVATGEVALDPVRSVVVSFADRPPLSGIARYEVNLDDTGDRLQLNNHARAALRVQGGEGILVMGGDGTPGNLARALTAAGLRVTCLPEGPIGLDRLLSGQVLVLEEVPADRLGGPALRDIARWVEHLGGGLMMTGGRRGFGSGGYHKSALEPVLPVTLELRDEHRKLAVGMAICLDRSGSMGAPAGPGRTKMDLADQGTAAVIDLLSARDQVAVYAVDSAPHTIIPLTGVTNREALRRKVLGIDSQGGGIYIYEALVAGGKALLASDRGTRHLVLFADAADSEEPGDYRTLLADFVAAGITVSVIGLGTPADCDADLLRDIASRGKGRIAFAADAVELPRLFAHEAVLLARSSWVEGRTRLEARAELTELLGTSAVREDWPAVDGYNLTYARERASVALWAPGDPAAPAVASWRIGTGRSVAVTVEVDGKASGDLLAWSGYVPVLAGLVRWAAGAADADLGTLDAERFGREVQLRLSLDPRRRQDWPTVPPELLLVREGDAQDPVTVAFNAVDDGVFEAHCRLEDDTVTLPTAIMEIAGRQQAVVGPALQLPYSPEAEPRLHRRSGAEVLAELAACTGGRSRDDLLSLYANPQSPGETGSLAIPLVILALILLLVEILARRFGLHLRRRLPRAAATAADAAPSPSSALPVDEIPPDDAPAAAHGLDRDQGLHEALRQLRQRRGK